MWQKLLLFVSILALMAGAFLALNIAPTERYMGDVYRILYVHVPTAWVALVGVVICFGASIVFLLKNSFGADALAEASAELVVVFGGLTIVLGSLWAKPTWNVWWTWDPRLTSTAILVLAFVGYLALRRMVEDPDKRALWSSVCAILISVDAPIIWFSVRWFGSVHQIQSTSDSVARGIGTILWINVFAFLLFAAWALCMRYQIAKKRLDAELEG